MYRHLIIESWKEYRMWLGHHPRLHVEFYFLSGAFNFGIEASKGADDDIQVSICPALFSLYIGVSSSFTRWLVNVIIKDYEPRQVSLRIFDWAIWWDCWAPSHSWSSGEPWWMRWTWHPIDTIFGRTKHGEREVSRTETVIPMPEKSYPCVVVMKAETWKRPRLPWCSAKLMRAHIDCKEGVPFPGKGENSWDCGDDAMHGTTCPAKTVEEGIASFVESVLKNRRRYGGSVNWRQKQPA